MMVAEQPDLFAPPRRARLPELGSPPLDPPRARLTDPETSRRAAEVAMGNAKAQRTALYGAVRARGAHGANASELDELMGWPAATSGRRLGEMARAPVPSIAAVPGLERRTASGNRGTVYQADAHAGRRCDCPECAEGRAYVAAMAGRRIARRRP